MALQKDKPQHCLIVLTEKWKSAVGIGKSFGALLTELSKAFHCLLHDVPLAKLNGYDFSLFALRLIHSYLYNIFMCYLSVTEWEHGLSKRVNDVLPGYYTRRRFLC